MKLLPLIKETLKDLAHSMRASWNGFKQFLITIRKDYSQHGFLGALKASARRLFIQAKLLRKEISEQGILQTLAHRKSQCFLILALFFLVFGGFWGHSAKNNQEIPVAKVEKRSFLVDVKTVGELEAERSAIISSPVRGDLGKIVFLIPDGANVQQNEVLVRMDPTPFEEKIEGLKEKIKEQQSIIVNYEKALEWELTQAEHAKQNAEYEVEAAELELNKILYGDGPLELSRLKVAMQKAQSKYDEMANYSNELVQLEEDGFINPIEFKNAQKKLLEEQEAYETARMQYENHLNHVQPAQIKKAEIHLKQSKIKQQDTLKAKKHSVGKASLELVQSRQGLEGLNNQLRQAEYELALTEIRAPSQGMIVHREDYRGGQRRKPRLGDVIIRNQAIMDLPELDSMMVKSKVREGDLCKVCIGKPASVEVDAYPDLSFPGKVCSIGVLALADFGRQTEEKYFELRVSLDKCDPRMRPGMTSRIVVHANQIEDVLTAPIHAVFQEQKKNFCIVKTWSGYEKRPVEIGAHNEEWAEIKSGLNQGEQVCLVMPIDVQ